MTKDEAIAEILRRLDDMCDERLRRGEAFIDEGAISLGKIHVHTADGIRRAIEVVREYQ